MAFGRDANVRWIRAEESEKLSATLDTVPNTVTRIMIAAAANSGCPFVVN